MSNEIENMKRKIKIYTASVIVLYFTMFLYLIFPDWVLDNITIVRSVGWILAIFFSGYLTIGDIHNLLDKNFFSEREKVDSYIREQLTQPCRDVSCNRALRRGILAGEKKNLMNLFYTFIPKDDTERERAFSYFGDYFITVNLSALSFLGMTGVIIFAVFVPLLSCNQRMVYFTLSLLLPALFNGLRYRTKRKLCEPAEAQTRRILTKDLDKLKQYLPNFRIFEVNTTCKDSTICPL